MRLFNRVSKLTVGTRELTGLDMQFQVKKTLKPEPNVCTIKIFNLAPDTRRAMEAGHLPGTSDPKGIPVRLEAGYQDGTSLLYFGDVRTVQTDTNGADVVTEISSGDGEKAFGTARVYIPVGPRTPPDMAMRAIIRALGVGVGNQEKALITLRQKGVASIFSRRVIVGSAAAALTLMCRSADLEWSIQDGNVQILDRGKALDGQAVLLASGANTKGPLAIATNTGLVGSPAVDNKGIVSATCLMIPDLRPGVKVVFDTRSVTGGYRVIEVDYEGDTQGEAWFAKIKAEKY